MSKSIKLQNILLPFAEENQPYFKLYYANGEALLDMQKQCLRAKRGSALDFSSYFNSISYAKWKQYTNVGDINLHLEVKGDFTLSVLAYGEIGENKDNDKMRVREEYLYAYGHKDDEDLPAFVGVTLYQQDYIEAARKEIVIRIPDSDAVVVGFKLITHGETEVYGGYYEGTVEEKDIRDVCLSLATTTFKKEDFILNNIKQLKESILEAGDELSENFYVHVVDNGRTLNVKEVEGRHVWVHPNPNVGGSGGFARGMIESLRQEEKKPTNILLMDDDVIIQPESIRRTYNLLKLVKDEYKDSFISGAMLYYEKRQVQHEDVGYLHMDGTYGPAKSWLDHYFFNDVVRNEIKWKEHPNQYAGWWYCCIPTSIAREDNLPLPLFVRGDDVEYSIRNHAKFITMNGICVWHMGFTQKFNAMMELYQVHRNSLAIQSFSGVGPEVDFAARIKRFFRTEILRFNYDSADLLLDSLEDYLKGPEFFREPNGEAIMQKQSKKNEQLVPMSEFPDQKLYIDELYEDVPISTKKLFLYRLTWNGLFGPKSLMDDETVVIPYDWCYVKGKQALHKNLLAVNRYSETAHMRVLDRKRGRELLRRSKKLFKEYEKNKVRIEQEYRAHFKEYTSAEFWEKYLGI